MSENEQQLPMKSRHGSKQNGDKGPDDPGSKKEPLRIQFGHDTTEEDVDRFLDMIFGNSSRNAQDGKESRETKRD